MRPGGGRGKGFGFEIEVSRILTLWMTGSPKPEVFWRSTGSGGAAEHQRKKGHKSNMDGDIMSVHATSTFVTDAIFFECKRYKKCDVFESFFFQKGQVFSWWAKLLRQASQANKTPMLIVRADRMPILIILPSKIVTALTAFAGSIRGRCDVWEFNREVCVIPLKEFLAWADVGAFQLFLCNHFGEYHD